MDLAGICDAHQFAEFYIRNSWLSLRIKADVNVRILTCGEADQVAHSEVDGADCTRVVHRNLIMDTIRIQP